MNEDEQEEVMKTGILDCFYKYICFSIENEYPIGCYVRQLSDLFAETNSKMKLTRYLKSDTG